MILSKMYIYYLFALYKYLVTCAMRKKRDEKKFNLRKKKFLQIEIQNRQSLTDDVNIIVAKSKISILHTRHVPLSYTIANRANRFSMLRFEPAWPTWMATSSTFINLFFLINVLLVPNLTLEYRVSFRDWGKREKKENNFSFTLRDDNYINHIYCWQ